jgi:hypothetical protein
MKHHHHCITRVSIGVLLTMALAACAMHDKMPVLTPVDGTADASLCRDYLSSEHLQLHHQAQFSNSAGGSLFFQSVTVVSEGAQRVRSAILSPEAMVLFDGEVTQDDRHVFRALGPFSNPDLSRWLIGDVALVYLAPKQWVAKGLGRDGCRICRYRMQNEATLDVQRCASGPKTLRQYDRQGKLVREVQFSAETSSTPDGRTAVPRSFTLQAFGEERYRIEFELISVKRLP